MKVKVPEFGDCVAVVPPRLTRVVLCGDEGLLRVVRFVLVVRMGDDEDDVVCGAALVVVYLTPGAPPNFFRRSYCWRSSSSDRISYAAASLGKISQALARDASSFCLSGCHSKKILKRQ